MMNLQRCYEVLELSPPISQADLKQAYKDLVQVWHPDRFAHNPRLQQKAQEKLKQINTAYETLEQWLQQQSKAPSVSARSTPQPPRAAAQWTARYADPFDPRSATATSRKTVLEQLSFRARMQLYGLAIGFGVLFLLWAPILLLYWLVTNPQALLRILLIPVVLGGIYYGLRQLSIAQSKRR